MENFVLSPRLKFLLRNLLKGFFWLFILLGLFLLFEEIVISKNPELWIERFYADPLIIYLIYFGSEFILGILPPELFMIWALHKGGVGNYILNVGFFALVSYAMGYLNFLIGQFLHKRVIFRYVRIKFLKDTWPMLKKYGIFLIIVAALTPVPWSAVSLLVGSSDYPSRKFLFYACSRLIRFAIYGFLVYQIHHF